MSDAKKKKLNINLTQYAFERLEQLSERSQLTKTQVVELMIRHADIDQFMPKKDQEA